MCHVNKKTLPQPLDHQSTVFLHHKTVQGRTCPVAENLQSRPFLHSAGPEREQIEIGDTV